MTVKHDATDWIVRAIKLPLSRDDGKTLVSIDDDNTNITVNFQTWDGKRSYSLQHWSKFFVDDAFTLYPEFGYKDVVDFRYDIQSVVSADVELTLVGRGDVVRFKMT